MFQFQTRFLESGGLSKRFSKSGVLFHESCDNRCWNWKGLKYFQKFQIYFDRFFIIKKKSFHIKLLWFNFYWLNYSSIQMIHRNLLIIFLTSDINPPLTSFYPLPQAIQSLLTVNKIYCPDFDSFTSLTSSSFVLLFFFYYIFIQYETQRRKKRQQQ